MIRNYQPSDQTAVIALMKQAIQTTNQADYTKKQLQAWSDIDETTWATSLNGHTALVMELSGQLVGFADMTSEGYLDRLFVHPHFLRQKIAHHLVTQLENNTVSPTFYTYASITARPFFEAHDYQVVRENKTYLRGENFFNYLMEKTVPPVTD